MKNTTKLLAFMLAVIMLVSALPLGVFAIEDAPATTATTPANGTPYTGDYYHYYNFDNVTLGKNNNSVTNPNGFFYDMRLDGEIRAHEDGSGYYLAARYKTKAWRAWQIGVVDSNTLTDYSMVNGLEISFRMRWVGSDAVVDGNTMSLINIRRSYYKEATAQKSYTNFNLLTAVYEASTTDLVIKNSNGVEVARLKKGATEFTEIKVDWHEATRSYSVFIDGVAKSEGVQCNDVRTSTSQSYYALSYDDDLIATRKAFEADKAYDRSTLQIGRVDPSSTSALSNALVLVSLTPKTATNFSMNWFTISG